MKRRISRSLFLSALVGSFVFLSQNLYAEPIATVTQIQGEVFIQKAGSAPDQWQAISQDTAVDNGDSVKTGNGTSTLSYADQADFRLEPNTSITLDQKDATQDINLKLGMLKAKINKQKTIKPFQVVTPTAVGAVRGTEVDFGYNEVGELTIDLHNDGPVQLVNEEAAMELELTDGKKISIIYDKENGKLTVKNDCNSSGDVNFSILGQSFSVPPCGETTADVEALETAAGAGELVTTDPPTDESENTPNEGEEEDAVPSEPSSPV